MSILDQMLKQSRVDCVPQKIMETRPGMGAKLSKVAEIFELDIIDEEEALKACKTIIGQHTKVNTLGTSSQGDVKVVK